MRLQPSLSTTSSLAGFRSPLSESRVLKEGFLTLTEESKQSGVDRFCQLTDDGRLLVKEEKGKRSLVVKECLVLHDRLFRLLVIDEMKLTQHKDFGLLCLAVNQEDYHEWLLYIESALRSRLLDIKNAIDSMLGYLTLVEFNYGSKKLNKKTAKMYLCFYYDKNLRVKGINGPQTSNFPISAFHIDEEMFPSSFIITTSRRQMLCQVEDPDQFKKWISCIHSDFGLFEAEEEEENVLLKAGIASELLWGLSADKMVRVKARYHCKTHDLEMTDFTGMQEVFFVQRGVFQPLEKDKKDGNFLLFVSSVDDLEEQETYQIHAQCMAKDYEKWFGAFKFNSRNVLTLVDTIVLQIEMLRIVKNDEKTKSSPATLTFHQVFHLMEMSKEQQRSDLSDTNKWPVTSLEKLMQMLLILLPQPLVPYHLQPDFIHLGREFTNPKQYNDSSCQKKAAALVEKMNFQSKGILSRIALHVYRLSSHFIQSDESVQGSEKKYRASITRLDHDLWSNLSKFIFRFEEQGISEKVAAKNIDVANHTIVCYQMKYIDDLINETKNSPANKKKRDMDQCLVQ